MKYQIKDKYFEFLFFMLQDFAVCKKSYFD